MFSWAWPNVYPSLYRRSILKFLIALHLMVKLIWMTYPSFLPSDSISYTISNSTKILNWLIDRYLCIWMNKEIDRYYLDIQIEQKRVYYRETIFVTSKPLLAEAPFPLALLVEVIQLLKGLISELKWREAGLESSFLYYY